MAQFGDYIKQAKSNLEFLDKVNRHAGRHYDWQVTVCFYVGVHLINAYLVNERGISFNSHVDTFEAVNPVNELSLIRLSEQNYLAYRKLYNLSRRARYIFTDEEKLKGQDDKIAYLTYEKHLERSIKNLDKLLVFIKDKYGESFPSIDINLMGIQSSPLKHFKYKRAS
jgi:hypothetical protein